METIITYALALSSAIGFIYGVCKLFRPKVALFKQLVVCAIGCMMLGRIYSLLFTMVGKEINTHFNIGMLGVFGGFMFLFSASYGQMDGLVDNKSGELAKYRLLSLFAPLGFIGVYVFLFYKLETLFDTIFLALTYIILGLSAYYSLKHVIIPDVQFGIIDSIRDYSLAALILAIFYGVQILGDKLEIKLLQIISGIGICVLYLAIIPIMERGSKKWTI